MNTITSRARRAARVGVALAVGVLAAGGAIVASTANAAVALCPTPIGTDPIDTFSIEAAGFDFGGSSGMTGNAPTCPGLLTWNLAGNTVTPHLTGTLYLKNSAGATARLQLKYFDVHDVKIGSNWVGPDRVALDDDEQFVVDMQPFANALVYRLDVTIQVKTAGTYTDLATTSQYLGTKLKPADDVTISSLGFDFGTGGLAAGAPAAPGTVTWLTANNTVQAQVDGDVYQKNAIGVETRLFVTTYDVHGAQIATASSVLPVPTGVGLFTTPVTLAPGASPLTYSAKVQLQNKVNGNWVDQGTAVTVSI